MRVSLLTLCAVLLLLDADPVTDGRWLLAVAAVSVLAATARPDSPASVVAVIVESAVGALAVVATGGASSPMLPYLAAIGFAAGMSLGVRGALLCAGATAATLLAGNGSVTTTAPETREYVEAAAQWTTLALIVGLVAGRSRSALRGAHLPIAERWAEAYRLIEQLRGVTRSLPGSLDPGTAATVLLDRVRAVADVQRGAVLLLAGDRFVPVALHGARRIPWRPSLAQPGPVHTAWQKRRAVVDHREADIGGRRQGSTLLVQPLFAGSDRPVGLLMAEHIGDGGFDAAAIAAIEQIVLECTPPLETAALFDELRLVAAAEERSRLAKEMHDGIAQDLAYLGYEVDAAVTSLDRDDVPTATERLRELRRGMTRLASDLRLSISDLRSSVGPNRGVGAALAEYTRSAGTGSGITVHMTLSEATVRLAAEDEIGVLRIAHEAIAASRRRSGTRNLWVSLTTDPPGFRLRIDDDGQQSPHDDRAKAAGVIKELAHRLDADVDTRPRAGGGVTVEVSRQETAI